MRASRKYSNKKTTVLVNPAPVIPMLVAQGFQEYPQIEAILSELESLNDKVHLLEATKLATEAGDAMAMNVVMLGALCGLHLLPFTREHFLDAIVGKVPGKYRELNLNQRAFEEGYERGRSQTVAGCREGGHD